MAEVVVYSSDYCPYCSRAKYLLESKNVDFEEIKVDGKPQIRAEMTKKAGRTAKKPGDLPSGVDPKREPGPEHPSEAAGK
uniref:GST N-terminal domain-containing protein n=1 Tax=Tanacetum cinerariifolium TaxID=118510 RepID=A0A699T9S6_TANCI|nr:hypothetical protein [Tanacetum cinerariifolium]